MKKLYIALATLALTFTSCSMELTPEGEIHDVEAVKTVRDCISFTRGLYAAMRTVTSGDNVMLSDIQLDDFHAVIGNGNRRMDFYNGLFLPGTGEIAGAYSTYYTVISQVNFFLDNAVALKNSTSLLPEDVADLNRCLGAAYFLRAYCYNSLADKFCQSYKNCTELDKEGLGLSLQLKYAPTADNAKYPGRSSMRATYAQIIDDLTKALDCVTNYETISKNVPAEGSIYITSDAVKALFARVYLNMGMDKQALDMAEAVTTSGHYKLSDRNVFVTTWGNDLAGEIIWMVDADFTYHGSALGDAFLNNTTKSDYLPTKDCIYLFDEDDIRWTAWFDEKEYKDGDKKYMMCRFNKYPGNPALYAATAQSNFVHKGKPFRVSELYLVAAEAAYNMGNDEKAKRNLKDLEAMRINNRSIINAIDRLSGSALQEEIRNERHRELIGEGFRLADLKRWNVGFTRGEVYENHEGLIVANYQDLHYNADDHRLVWPIPQHELDTNPQVKGQQNPGY